MTTEVVTLPMDASVRQAAAEMRDHDIGDVLVVDGDELCGVVTDRDLVVRVVAENGDLDAHLGDVCSSGDLVTARPDTSVDDVVQMLREAAVRRVPVVDDQKRPVGMVSIGDLAITEDSRSALADISAAPPNT
ncbi:CBS domain-containing protein [Jiangella rhizosphaerae]|uniref:CBS domain-containing protein n=2 Tax=Jiangella rhizosphaerae TaxID=2293569 RepID=A0A418KMP5_9ACTN|nr:CBS domain-containing protein [Jiangella rhizosphaerae]